MFKILKMAVIAFGLAMLLGGWAYGHSTEFRVECTLQKEGIIRMHFPKNIICDGMFDLK